jgi:hypothetical protein
MKKKGLIFVGLLITVFIIFATYSSIALVPAIEGYVLIKDENEIPHQPSQSESGIEYHDHVLNPKDMVKKIRKYQDELKNKYLVKINSLMVSDKHADLQIHYVGDCEKSASS